LAGDAGDGGRTHLDDRTQVDARLRPMDPERVQDAVPGGRAGLFGRDSVHQPICMPNANLYGEWVFYSVPETNERGSWMCQCRTFRCPAVRAWNFPCPDNILHRKTILRCLTLLGCACRAG